MDERRAVLRNIRTRPNIPVKTSFSIWKLVATFFTSVLGTTNLYVKFDSINSAAINRPKRRKKREGMIVSSRADN